MKKRRIHAICRDVGRFFRISGASKSVFAIHFKLSNISKGLGGRMCLKASAVPSIFAWKQISPRKQPPPTKRPYQRHRKVGKSFPEKESFSASLEPSKTPEATSDNNVIPLNLFGVANQMWSVCAFLCNIQDPVLTS